VKSFAQYVVLRQHADISEIHINVGFTQVKSSEQF